MINYQKILIHWKIIFSFILISLSGYAQAASSNSGTGGIPRVLEQLEKLSTQLSQVQSQLVYQQQQLESQQQQLTELQQETIDCTPDRYLNNLCGEGNTPFDLVVSICGSLGGEVAIDGKYALEAKIAYGGGIGWKEVGDGDLTIDGGFPIPVVTPYGPPIIIPNEVAVGASGSVGLGIDTCFEGIKIPIGRNIDRERVIALLNKLEMGAVQAQSALLDAVDSAFNSRTVATALEAKETFASLEFSSSDPLAVFSSPEVMILTSVLPAGDRMNSIITDPGSMIPEVDPLTLNLCTKFENSPVVSAHP